MPQTFGVPDFLLRSLLSTQGTDRFHPHAGVGFVVRIEDFHPTVAGKLHLVDELEGVWVEVFVVIYEVDCLAAWTCFLLFHAISAEQVKAIFTFAFYWIMHYEFTEFADELLLEVEYF